MNMMCFWDWLLPSAYRLGECHKYGKIRCPQNPALSIHRVSPFSS